MREKINPWVIPEGGASSGDYSPGPEHSISASTSTIPYMGPGTTTRGFQQPEKTTFTITEKSAKKGGNNKDITSSTSTSRPLKTLSSSKSLNSLVGALTGIPLFETSISTATMTERGYHVVCWMVTSMTLMYFIQTFYLKVQYLLSRLDTTLSPYSLHLFFSLFDFINLLTHNILYSYAHTLIMYHPPNPPLPFPLA